MQINKVADYDGDQCPVRGIWSDESNLEAEKIMNSKISVLNITGKNAKVVAKEVANSIYELTKDHEKDKPAKTLTSTQTQEFLDLKPENITRTFLTDNFADVVNNADGKNHAGKHESRYNTWDKIKVPAGYFYDDQPELTTTVGRFILNKFILQGAGVIAVTKYNNDILNKKKIGDMDDLIGQMLMENHIVKTQFNAYIDRRDCLGYWLNGMLSHTISERMLKPLPEIEKKKAELVAKYKDELDKGNIDVMTQISDELIKYAKELLKDDPGMDLYDSGDLDFNNNYKNNAIIKGAVRNKITNEFDFISTSFMDGMDPKDIPANANSILASQYPASIATADAGYLGKKIQALLQMMEIDELGTDCHTKNLIPIKVTKTNASNLVYSWIEQGGQLQMMTKEMANSLMGQTVKMRSPMTCTGEKICSKCAGMLFYYLEIQHAGLFGVQISHADLNLGLKAKHNSVVDLYTINPDDLIVDIQ